MLNVLKALRFNSIKKKLIFFMTGLSIFAVLAGVISSALYSMRDARESITNKMNTTTEIVGSMSEGALLFDDEAVAREALSVLKNEQEIVLACLYKANDTLLGKYAAAAAPANALKICPTTPQEAIIDTAEHSYQFQQVIRDANGEKAGTILIFANLATLQDFISKQVWMTIVIVLIVSIIALGVSYVLQPYITGPILSLVSLTRRISEEKDYSLRAETNSGDEVGALSASFNHMLATIQEREKELYEINEKAETANRSKSQFLANMSHEIRTPINGILGFAQLLSVMPLDEKQRSFVDIILTSGNNLLTVINDILDFSKIEAGKLHIESVPFDLSRSLEGVVDSLAARAEEKGLDVILRYAPGTPNFVIGDTARVRQVLLNFMSNAIKFTEKGHVMLNAEARILGNTETIIRFEVRDTGIGISKDAQKKIFEKFIQADASTTKRYGGTGLGLAISHQLAQLMGGEVGVNSEPGKGSTFWFEVPFRLDQAQPQNYNLPKIDLSDVHLLVVDDHELNRRILLELAHGWNVKAAAAESGEEALRMMKQAKAQGKPFQIAILDYQLPNMDGEDLSNLIKTDMDLADTSLILLTSMGMRGDAGKFQEIGFEAYLVKPARASVLLDTVSTVWMNRMQGRQQGGIITQHSFASLDNRRDETGNPDNRQEFADPLAALQPQRAAELIPQQAVPATPVETPTFPVQAASLSEPTPEPHPIPQSAQIFVPQPPQAIEPEPAPPPAPEPAPQPAPEPVRTSFTKYVPSQPLDVSMPADEAIFTPPPSPSAPVPEVPMSVPHKPGVPFSGNAYPKRILLVEDQLTNRLVVETILDNMQLGSAQAENGVEAVQKAAMQDFDIILMDVQMPIMNGFDATREIRKIEEREGKRRAVIIAVTANAMAGDRERCIEAGMDDYISKPIQVIELQEMVQKYLNQR